VTYNLKDFRPHDLKPWNIEALSPDAETNRRTIGAAK
jgi:hypothetical protein